MTNRTFDRVVHFDDRSRAYPIRTLIRADAVPRSYTWSCDVWLDQGNEGACVGFAIAQEAAARPVVVSPITNNVAQQVYLRAKQLDQFKGENYEGTSVLGGIKAGKDRGWYGEYRWAFGEPDLALAVGYKGPAVLGINWYDGMMDPDASGFLRVTGQIAGGHAILCNGYNVTKKAYKVHNSWGMSWGNKGEAWISVDDMARLLGEQGEACIPVVRTYGKA
jgi:hypothetical protein